MDDSGKAEPVLSLVGWPGCCVVTPRPECRFPQMRLCTAFLEIAIYLACMLLLCVYCCDQYPTTCIHWQRGKRAIRRQNKPRPCITDYYVDTESIALSPHSHCLAFHFPFVPIRLFAIAIFILSSFPVQTTIPSFPAQAPEPVAANYLEVHRACPSFYTKHVLPSPSHPHSHSIFPKVNKPTQCP